MLFGLPDLHDLDLSSEWGIGAGCLRAWNGEEEMVPGAKGWISNGESPAWPDA
jgi:hypothetical protein